MLYCNLFKERKLRKTTDHLKRKFGLQCKIKYLIQFKLIETRDYMVVVGGGGAGRGWGGVHAFETQLE